MKERRKSLGLISDDRLGLVSYKLETHRELKTLQVVHTEGPG